MAWVPKFLQPHVGLQPTNQAQPCWTLGGDQIEQQKWGQLQRKIRALSRPRKGIFKTVSWLRSHVPSGQCASQRIAWIASLQRNRVLEAPVEARARPIS